MVTSHPYGRAGEIVVEAESVIGAQLDKQEKAKPGPKGKSVMDSNRIATIAEVLPDVSLPIAKKRLARASKVGAIPKTKREQLIRELKKADKPVTVAALLQAAKRETNENRKTAIKAKPAATAGDCPLCRG